MKKLLLVLVCLSFVCLLAVPAFAGSGRFANEQADQVGYVDVKNMTANGSAINRPVFVYAVQWISSGASGNVNLYDSAEIYSLGDPLIEVAEYTSGDSVRYEFAKPVKFDKGIYVELTTGSTVIEYR